MFQILGSVIFALSYARHVPESYRPCCLLLARDPNGLDDGDRESVEGSGKLAGEEGGEEQHSDTAERDKSLEDQVDTLVRMRHSWEPAVAVVRDRNLRAFLIPF